MTIRGTVDKPTKVNRMPWIKPSEVTKTTPRFPASASAAARSAPVLHALLRPPARAHSAISEPADSGRDTEGKRHQPKQLDPRLRRNP
jgi:hypothetical protein